MYSLGPFTYRWNMAQKHETKTLFWACIYTWKTMAQKHFIETKSSYGILLIWEMKAWSSHVPRKMMQDIGFVIKFAGNLGSTVYKSELKGKCFMFLCHFLRILKRRNICFWHKKCSFLAQKMFPETHVFVPKWHKNTCFLYV